MKFELFGGQFFNPRHHVDIRVYKFATASLSLMLLCVAGIVFDLNRRGKLLPLDRGFAPAQMQEVKVEAPPVVPTVELLVPKFDLELGTILESEMFEVKSVVASMASPDMLRSTENIKGKITVRKLPKGTLALTRDFSATHENFPFDLPIGSRAVTVETDSASSVEGYARPGSFVDVNFVFTNDKDEKTITTLVHNAKVASVNGSTNPLEFVPSKGHFPLTLVVSERDAKAIRLATASGTISLSLVGTPELVVADPRTETFSLANLAITAPEKEEESFTMTPRVVKTTNEADGKEKVMITNRREKPSK